MYTPHGGWQVRAVYFASSVVPGLEPATAFVGGVVRGEGLGGASSAAVKERTAWFGATEDTGGKDCKKEGGT